MTAAVPEPRLELRPVELHLVAPEVAPRVIAPAADAISPRERDRIAAEEPLSLLRVLGPEGVDGADAGRRAGDRIRQLVAEGVFVPVGPAFAFHEVWRDDHRQLGLVAEIPVAHCADGLVRAHEATRRRHESTLAAFTEAAGMDVSPVSLTYRARPEIDRVAGTVTAREPDLDVVGWGGIRHRVWVVDDATTTARLRQLFRDVGQLTIVDGHHRIAAARRRAASHPAEATFLAVLYPDRELAFASYDRCVDLDAHPSDELVTALSRTAQLSPCEPGPPSRPDDRHHLLVLAGGRWHELWFDDAPDDVPEGLAVTLLQERVLGPLLGVEDPRSDPRLVYVPGTQPLSAFEADCSRADRVGFVLPPVTLDELQRVAERGAVLPPKSTYSDPKPGPGLFLRLRAR